VLGKDYRDQDCLIARALEVIGERWTLLIVRDAFWGVRRYTDFLQHLDIPRAILSERLKALVAHGVMRREPDPDRPGREIYELTDAGVALWPVVHGLNAWASAHLGDGEPRRVFTHIGCGQPLDPTGRCACPSDPAPGEIVMSLHPSAHARRTDRVSRALAEPHRLLTPLEVDATAGSTAHR
jgi:DNA-binding HxlR family transcriptional regulator